MYQCENGCRSSKPSSTERGRHWAGSLAIALLSVAALLNAGFVEAAVGITSARWDSSNKRLIVKGSGGLGKTVRVVNAYSMGQVLGSGTVTGTGWTVRASNPSPVPCRVRAIQSNGQTAERNVNGAPSSCSPKAPPANRAPTANAGPDRTVTIATGQTKIVVTLDGSGSSDTDGTISVYNWTGNPDPGNTVKPAVTLAAGSYTFTLIVTDNAGAASAADTVKVTVNAPAPPVACNPANPNVSINSTSQSGCPTGLLPQQAKVANTTYSVLAINDLGMHCGDLDTRISSILPPFQVLLAQVIQKGAKPDINPPGITLAYSAAANPNDPILGQPVDGMLADGDTFKTNFWDAVVSGSYDPFYPGGLGITPLDTGDYAVTADKGLPVPNVEDLYIGPDGVVNSGDERLRAVQHAMPGIADPYSVNTGQLVRERYLDKPFFVNFPFGYVAADVDWFEGAGIPFASFDDMGRENAYPLVRVQAKNAAGSVLSTLDTVLPISGEASCTNCHTANADYTSVHGVPNRTDIPANKLIAANLPVATSLDDSDANMPPRVSLEYAADINVLRLHDLKHKNRYVSTACDNVPANENCLTTAPAPCVIDAAHPNGTNANCLTYRALELQQPVVCQTCHYTPALDLAQVGPKAGPEGSEANGRNQLAHPSNSRVMHDHHGSITALDRNGVAMFPNIPAPIQTAAGVVTNQASRATALENSCYQCHPGKNVQCLRGAMYNGDMLCSDCHGSMLQVGNDFSKNVSPSKPGSFILAKDFYNAASATPRVPWANEPGCGSCHTGDFNSRLTTGTGLIVNTVDTNGNTDGIRLRQAFRTGDAKATPIVPANKRFAEPVIPARFGTFANPGAGNPQLYRVSSGHGGVMCEGCHGATHAEWPNAKATSNDNLAAIQLQGHTGTIIECSTCHGTSSLGNTLKGPHGMHPVGNDTSVASGSAAGPQIGFVDGGHEDLGDNFANCSVCHGSGDRKTNQGTVLSVAKKDRRLNGRTILAGTPIGCNTCHD